MGLPHAKFEGFMLKTEQTRKSVKILVGVSDLG